MALMESNVAVEVIEKINKKLVSANNKLKKDEIKNIIKDLNL